jgi:hypothetical protein
MANKKLISIFIGIVFFVLLYLFNMAYFSIKPDFFSVEKKVNLQKGVVFSDTIVKLIQRELDSSSGWTPNDIPPSPTWFLDNRPNFQLGVLEVVRYSSRVLRDNLSRQRTTDKIDMDCDKAFTNFSNDPYKWIIPSAEGKYKKGVEDLQRFIKHLKIEEENFYPRSDNLIQLLEQYVSLLGGVNNRLLNASRKIDKRVDRSASDNKDEHGKYRFQHVPWRKIDDNFYYAQGVGYAIYHMFKAVHLEFIDVLKDKNAEIIVDDIITSFEESYFEPVVVTNGSKAGLFANHSSNLRVFLDDARQKINSLIRMLDQG